MSKRLYLRNWLLAATITITMKESLGLPDWGKGLFVIFGFPLIFCLFIDNDPQH